MNVRGAHVVESLNLSNSFLPGNASLKEWPHLQGLCEPVEVDVPRISVLIGEDVPVAHQILEYKWGTDPENEPYGARFHFGWSIAGPTGVQGLNSTTNVISSTENHMEHHGSQTESPGMTKLEDMVERFWNEESHGFRSDDCKTLSQNDKKAIQILHDTTELKDGRYTVGMLWKESRPFLNYNFKLAEKRYKQVLGKCLRNPEYAQMYDTCIRGFIDKGYMVRLSDAEVGKHSSITWYLPHHGVQNENKPGKVRVVNDAAAEYMGTSLNNQLLTGPDLINSLDGVILRFRMHRVAIMADIEEMFMQVGVTEADQDALRIIWWGDGVDGPPVHYKMTRHIFGATDSPCVCTHALRRCALDNPDEFSDLALRTVLQNFYVDDLLVSCPDNASAAQLCKEVSELVAKGGFQLKKFVSNSEEALSSLPHERRSSSVNIQGKQSHQRTLGIDWDMTLDVLKVKINKRNHGGLTRASCLSVLCSLYDPAGYTCPATLEAKLILQEACKAKLDWTAPLPPELHERWLKWESALDELEKIAVPRCYLESAMTWEDVAFAQLHHFSDASEYGYGTVSYIRIERHDGSAYCRLLYAKSRCAPKHFVSIPRLELQAATVLARVDRMLRRELVDITFTKVVFWIDSTISLAYIKNEDRRLKTYVANRVEEIRDSSEPKQWRYCPSKLNPADMCSIGIKPAKLTGHPDWISGPKFLSEREDSWPKGTASVDLSNDEETKARVFTNLIQDEQAAASVTERFSELEQASRAMAWLRKTCHALLRYRISGVKINLNLTITDLNQARLALIRIAQRDRYLDEIERLINKRPVGRNSSLAALNPFYDVDDHVIRVGGRINGAEYLSYENRHQAILPKDHHVTTLFIHNQHRLSAHAGQQQTLAELRKRYWVVNGKSTIRQILHNCVTCRKIKAEKMSQIMADLPPSRTAAYAPCFNVCGVDAFGPLQIKRARRTYKKYGLLFTCFSTRAVHLEVLNSMDTGTAINAIRRFINRRGRPSQLWTDNGGNLVGSSKELRQAMRDWNAILGPEMVQRDIDWKFQTPYASHMSGVFERLIKTCKQSLKAVLGTSLVDEETLQTVFTEVEAVMNSRPLIPASDDPEDYQALTPMHFLIGSNYLAYPPASYSDTDPLRRRWKSAQAFTDLVWKRWIRLYIPELQARSKWLRHRRSAAVGDLVLLSDEMKSRGHWPMGRIVKVLPSACDGRVRSVQVKTASGLYYRPIHKLCLLEAVTE